MSLIRTAWRSIFRRRDLRPIYDWARENTDLKPPLTITGAFDVSRSRHFMAPLDALQDDHVREVNVLKPVRGGGTLIADIYIPWARVNDPGPTMFVLQTDPIADDHCAKVLMPTLESVPAVREMLANLDRFAITGRKIEFADGNHLHINGPSIGNLQTNAFRVVILDECWLYPEMMVDAEGRVGDFTKLETSKILRISQGGPKENLELDHCAWNRAYNRGERNEWEVQCPHCQQYYEPVFNGAREDGSYWGIVWDRHTLPNGDYNLTKCCETIRFECPHCRKPVMDCPRTKAEWNRTGRYKLIGEANRKRKSYHWEAVIDYPWDELVTLWLDAENAARRGDLSAKLTFYQKRRAIHKDETSLRRTGIHFLRTEYEAAKNWENEEARFATFDKQAEGVYWGLIRAWSKDRTRRLWFGRLLGEGEIAKKVEDFKVPANRVGIDSGYEPKGDSGVYAMCVRNGWLALKGDDRYEFINTFSSGRKSINSYSFPVDADPEIGTTSQGRRCCKLIRFSKHRLTQMVQDAIDAGQFEEPKAEGNAIEEEYNSQMGAVFRMVEYNKRTGKSQVFWKEGKNDHARDCSNMQMLFAILTGLRRDPATEQLTKTEQKETQ